MVYITCIDDRFGVSFNGRRQSRDSAVTQDILNTVGDSLLYTSPYSAELFPDERICVSDDPMREDCNFVFCESGELSAYLSEVDKVIIYRWNRHYPADRRLDICIEDSGFRCVERHDFSGSSHERLTKEIFVK